MESPQSRSRDRTRDRDRDIEKGGKVRVADTSPSSSTKKDRRTANIMPPNSQGSKMPPASGRERGAPKESMDQGMGPANSFREKYMKRGDRT